MKVEVKLPALGDSDTTEVTVSFWYFDTGEKVSEGDDLLEVLTDKAAFNVPAPASGKLVETSADEGQAVKVGDILGRIETEQ
ncbi:MAG: lipoyl domain-containing protein [Planctomycetes bacterium]|nr:lipoyl domain-containing protein [Planctomycetota bacterium]